MAKSMFICSKRSTVYLLKLKDVELEPLMLENMGLLWQDEHKNSIQFVECV